MLELMFIIIICGIYLIGVGKLWDLWTEPIQIIAISLWPILLPLVIILSAIKDKYEEIKERL